MSCQHERLMLVRRYIGKEIFSITSIEYPDDDERDEQNPFDGALVTLSDVYSDEYVDSDGRRQGEGGYASSERTIFCRDCNLVLARNPDIEEV